MYNNRPETDEIEIDLLKLVQVLLLKIKFIIAITLLAALGTFAVTYYLVTPMYTATAMMYVNNSSFSLGNTSFSISQGELSAAQSLVATYVVILKSRTTLEDIIARDGLQYNYEELYDMIESEAVNSTEIFNVNVTSPDPQEAEQIANTIAQVLPERIADIVDGSDVRIVDYAVVPSERTSPSFTMNTVIGALVGFVLAVAIVILRYLFDDQVHEEEDLTQTYPDIPLLAVVPDMLSSEGKGYYYSSSSSGSSDRSRRSGDSKKKPHESATSHKQNSRDAQPARPQQPAQVQQRPQRPQQNLPVQRPQPAQQPRQGQPHPTAQTQLPRSVGQTARPESVQPQKRN